MNREECLYAIRVATGINRTDAARLVLDGHRTRVLTTEDLREWVPDTWTYLSPPVHPHGALPAADWVELFSAMGFYMATPEIDLGTEPYTVYRAAPADRVRGMSWCTHEAMARSFRPVHKMYGHYQLWRTSVTTTAVLAVLYRPSDSWVGPGSETAREVVVDPARLGEVISVP